MIIQALYNYYQTLLEDSKSGISPPGFSSARISHCLIVSKQGQLINIVDLRDTQNNKLVSPRMIVPEQIKRSSGIAPNFICDVCSYVLGLPQKGKEDKKGRARECFRAYVSLQNSVLNNIEDEGARALLSFLNGWNPDVAEENEIVLRYLDDITDGANLIFKLDGDKDYLHECAPIIDAWKVYRSNQAAEYKCQCLVTGEESNIAKLHHSIKGVTGAQSSGASLVSFNQDAFTSYGKEQSYNAPVSEEVAFGYTTALNYLLSKTEYRVRVGDTTVVFWAEKSTQGLEEDLIGALINPPQLEEENTNNKKKFIIYEG